MSVNDKAILSAILRSEFLCFLRRCMMTLNPGAALLDNWHLQAVAHQLEQVRAGRVKRLIINLPPRHLKSLMASVALPAFLLGHNPRLRIICTSYGAELVNKHAGDFRAIVQSPWYRQIFPAMQVARATETEVRTTQQGFRMATSVYSALTGFGGDIIIIDDPQKPVDAQSQAKRDGLNEWYSNTLRSRLDSQRDGVILLVTQRVHQHDLTGYLLAGSEEWIHLCLPAIAEVDERIPIGAGSFHCRRRGEALHPEREPLEILEKLRTDMGPDVFSAQYQQAPVPPGGSMIRREWLRYYDQLPERTYRGKVIMSLDTAAKGGAQNDWSVCTVWLLLDDLFYLIEVVRGRFDYPLLRSTVLELAKRFEPDDILIEDASTGTALAQELRETRYPVTPVPIEHDKVGRLYVQQAKFSSGRVLFPRNAPFLAELESELLSFPQGKNDDQVDSITQALAYEPSGYDETLSWVET